MVKKSFNPTSLESRKLQNEARMAHRIKLKKQLEKAKKNMGISSQPSDEVKVKRPVRKDPIMAAVDKREERVKVMKEQAEERSREMEKQRVEKEMKVKSRERIRKKLTERTRKGQPKLSNHIDALLQKIEKSV